MPILLILFIGVPIAEIALFIEIGELIGLWPTLATIVITALIGTALVRHQGLAVLAEARHEMDQSRAPVKAVLTGICLLLAGALLLTPGFLTDAIGFALLIPPIRLLIAGFLLKRVLASGKVHVHGHGGGFGPDGPGAGPHGPRGGSRGGPIIDGEFSEVADPAPPASDRDGPSRIPPAGEAARKDRDGPGGAAT